MGAIIEAIGSPEFLAGLRWGGITAAVGLILCIAWRRWRKERAPVAAVAAVVAAIAAMTIVRPLDANLLAGLGLLLLAGATFPWTRRVPFLPVLVALPGAWLIGRSGLPESEWVVPLVILVIVLGGPVISWFDENSKGSLLPALLFALTAAGIWVTVPDTEEALVLFGAVTAPTLLAWPLGLARLGPVGAHALVGLFIWVIAWGGRGREGSIVGAVAGLGMLITAPIAAWMARKPSVTTAGWLGIWLLVLQVVVVGVVTRVAGLRANPIDAAMIAIPTLVAALLLWVVIERSISHAPRSDPTV